MRDPNEPRICDLDVPIKSLDVPIDALTWADIGAKTWAELGERHATWADVTGHGDSS